MIDGTVTIDTDVSNTANDGVIDFGTNTINASSSGADSLTLQSGSGTITLGTIGVTTALNDLSINASDSAAAALTIKQIGTFDTGNAGVTRNNNYW